MHRVSRYFMFAFPRPRSRNFLLVPAPQPTIYTPMDYLEKGKRVLDIEILELTLVRDRLNDDFSRAVAMIKEVVDNRGKVVAVGVGKSGQIGAKNPFPLTRVLPP